MIRLLPAAQYVYIIIMYRVCGIIIRRVYDVIMRIIHARGVFRISDSRRAHAHRSSVILYNILYYYGLCRGKKPCDRRPVDHGGFVVIFINIYSIRQT